MALAHRRNFKSATIVLPRFVRTRGEAPTADQLQLRATTPTALVASTTKTKRHGKWLNAAIGLRAFMCSFAQAFLPGVEGLNEGNVL